MDLGRRLLAVGAGARATSFDRFCEAIDQHWIEEALVATGTATVRKRKLPAAMVVWIVIAMALFRDRSILEVVHHLDLILPEKAKEGTRRGVVTNSAVVQARDRLGPNPLEQLFERTAACWAAASARADPWRGLAVYGVDGSVLRVPDTSENEAAFGRPGSGRGAAGYPQLRVVALMVLRAHILAGLSLGPCTVGERTLAESLLAKIPDQSLTILDRGFLAYSLLHRLQRNGSQRHWLIRAKSNLKWRTLRRLGSKDELAEITIARQARRSDPDLPERLIVRVIRYQHRGFRTQTLLTSLLDPDAHPAAEVVALYHERWELELGFDEIKTHALEREESLRSRAPERVRQEVWGLAIAYNLVRLHMEHVAHHAGTVPTRISFRHALLLIRNFWLTAWITSPGNLPARLNTLHQELALLILPPRRARRYPRAVKIKMSGYPRKRR